MLRPQGYHLFNTKDNDILSFVGGEGKGTGTH